MKNLYLQRTLVEKKDFPEEIQGKPNGNNKFTTNFHGVSILKTTFSMWFPSRGSTLRSGLHASIAWKLGLTSDFPIWKIEETKLKPKISKGKEVYNCQLQTDIKFPEMAH